MKKKYNSVYEMIMDTKICKYCVLNSIKIKEYIPCKNVKCKKLRQFKKAKEILLEKLK